MPSNQPWLGADPEEILGRDFGQLLLFDSPRAFCGEENSEGLATIEVAEDSRDTPVEQNNAF